jgi:translation initiation factor 1
MSEDDNNNTNSLSIDDIVRELDREETNIVIFKDIKKFNKPTTVLRGLENRKDAHSIARELKMKLGTGGTYKDGQIILQGDHRESVRNYLIAKGFKQESIEKIRRRIKLILMPVEIFTLFYS